MASVKSGPGLTARLLIAALLVVVGLVIVNVTFFVAERRAALRGELAQITERVADELVANYETYLGGIVASASNYAFSNATYRDAALGFDGSYDARVAIYNALINLQSGFPAIVNAYVVLPEGVITFRLFTGEFTESDRLPEFELASQMAPGVAVDIVHERHLDQPGVDSVVSTLLIRPFRAIGRPDVIVMTDVSVVALQRKLADRVPLLERFSVTSGSPDEMGIVPESGELMAAAVSTSFDRGFQLTLRDDTVVGRRKGLVFVLGSAGTALLVFLIAAILLVRQLSPLERELQRLAVRPSNLSTLADAVRSLTQDNEQLRVRYDRVLPHYRRRVMNHLLLGLLSEGEVLNERLAFTRMKLPDPPYAALCVLFAKAEQSDRESASLILLVSSAVEIEIGHEAADLLGPVDAIRHGTVIPAQTIDRLDAVLERLPAAARDRIYMGAGHAVATPGELAASYDAAKRALTFRRLLGGRVFNAGHIAARVRDEHGYPFEAEAELLQAVQRRDANEADRLLAEFMHELRDSDDAVRGLEYLRLQLLHVLEGRLAAAGASPSVLDQTIDQYPLEYAHTPAAMLSLFQQLVKSAVEEGADSGRPERQVERFLRFIEEHHADTGMQLLTLEEKFGLSRYYIGRRIREETGLHFSEHVNRARVEHGAALLADAPDLPIKEIAVRVGYSYDYYFARQFRQIYGISPSEYRERAIRSSTDRTDS